MVVSLLARPFAGVLADSRERRLVAAAGAGLFAVSCAGYATATLAGSLGVAYAAAVVGGVGGALLWVSLRAVVGERLAEDPSVYARLFSREETGSWVAFVAGLVLVYPTLGYPPAALGLRGRLRRGDRGAAPRARAARAARAARRRRVPGPRGPRLPGTPAAADAGRGRAAHGRRFQTSSWQVACLVAAAVMLASAVLVPRSVRALGVVDVPVSTEMTPATGAGAVPAAPPPGGRDGT